MTFIFTNEEGPYQIYQYVVVAENEEIARRLLRDKLVVDHEKMYGRTPHHSELDWTNDCPVVVLDYGVYIVIQKDG